MRIMLVVLATLSLVPKLASGTSLIERPLDGSVLVHQCQIAIRVMDAAGAGTAEDIRVGADCGNYVQGYRDGLVASRAICLKLDVPNGTVVRTYSAFMQQHPEFLKKYEGDGLFAALRSNFRCSKT
jgi:Rap1a immunity proteins